MICAEELVAHGPGGMGQPARRNRRPRDSMTRTQDGREEYHVRDGVRVRVLSGTQQVHPLWALRHQEAFMQLSNSQRVLVAAALGATLLALGGSALGAAGKGKGSTKAKIVIKGSESSRTPTSRTACTSSLAQSPSARARR